MSFLALQLAPFIQLTDEQFYELARVNRDLRLEQTVEGSLIVMAPTGWGVGIRNRRLTQQLGFWADHNGTGESFDSSTGFQLPNGAKRSPDASWVRLNRLVMANVSQDEFLPLAPDFVAEIRAEEDTLTTLRSRMLEYIDQGVRLGWLINVPARQVEIYRLNQSMEVLNSPISLSGEAVLSGFLLDLRGILS
jgi:Uma2 family endonuclease